MTRPEQERPASQDTAKNILQDFVGNTGVATTLIDSRNPASRGLLFTAVRRVNALPPNERATVAYGLHQGQLSEHPAWSKTRKAAAAKVARFIDYEGIPDDHVAKLQKMDQAVAEREGIPANALRKVLVDFVTAHPGKEAKEIAVFTGLGIGRTRLWLAALEKQEFITKNGSVDATKPQQQATYSPTDAGAQVDLGQLYSALKTYQMVVMYEDLNVDGEEAPDRLALARDVRQARRDVVHLLASHGFSSAAIADIVDISPTTAITDVNFLARRNSIQTQERPSEEPEGTRASRSRVSRKQSKKINREIIRGLRRGEKPKQIASALDISENNFRQRVYYLRQRGVSFYTPEESARIDAEIVRLKEEGYGWADIARKLKIKRRAVWDRRIKLMGQGILPAEPSAKREEDERIREEIKHRAETGEDLATIAEAVGRSRKSVRGVIRTLHARKLIDPSILPVASRELDSISSAIVNFIEQGIEVADIARRMEMEPWEVQKRKVTLLAEGRITSDPVRARRLAQIARSQKINAEIVRLDKIGVEIPEMEVILGVPRRDLRRRREILIRKGAMDIDIETWRQQKAEARAENARLNAKIVGLAKAHVSHAIIGEILGLSKASVKHRLKRLRVKGDFTHDPQIDVGDETRINSVIVRHTRKGRRPKEIARTLKLSPGDISRRLTKLRSLGVIPERPVRRVDPEVNQRINDQIVLLKNGGLEAISIAGVIGISERAARHRITRLQAKGVLPPDTERDSKLIEDPNTLEIIRLAESGMEPTPIAKRVDMDPKVVQQRITSLLASGAISANPSRARRLREAEESENKNIVIARMTEEGKGPAEIAPVVKLSRNAVVLRREDLYARGAIDRERAEANRRKADAERQRVNAEIARMDAAGKGPTTIARLLKISTGTELSPAAIKERVTRLRKREAASGAEKRNGEVELQEGVPQNVSSVNGSREDHGDDDTLGAWVVGRSRSSSVPADPPVHRPKVAMAGTGGELHEVHADAQETPNTSQGNGRE